MINKGKLSIAGVFITACDYSYIVSETTRYIQAKKMFLVSPIAAQTIARAYNNPDLLAVLTQFTYLVPDGYWVKKALEWKFGICLKQRVYGPLLTQHLLSLADKEQYRIAIYGTTSETLGRLKRIISIKYPKATVATIIPSLFRPLTKYEYASTIRQINKSKADILFIALGSPKQEEFAVQLTQCRHPQLDPLALFTIGAAADFLTKTKRQSPAWMGERGLEWLFRFLQEPKRLWRRYLIYGLIYLYILGKDIFFHRKKMVSS